MYKIRKTYRSTALILMLLTTSKSFAQTNDTLQNSISKEVILQPVELKQYFNKQYLLKLTTSTHSLQKSTLQSQSPTSVISAMNTVAGIRMEERSPGSYRLAMRGSLIRSPFGIRNTKIYIDDMPFTDAGGNTYLNLLDPNGIASIDVIKGPDGSLFGANSGGVIRIQPVGLDRNTANNLEANITYGSYDLFQQNIQFSKLITPFYNFTLNQSYQKSEGYRDNAAFERKTIQTAHQWQYKHQNYLKLFALYSDVDYQTPGGLTLAQYEENPKASRPAAGPNPSAREQKAAIYNKTGYLGINHEAKILPDLTHYIAIFGSYTDFENPFITNYEYRIEKNLGTRTYLSFSKPNLRLPYEVQIGIEASQGWNTIKNYDNNSGIAGEVQAEDNLNNFQFNAFSRLQVSLNKNWLAEGSIGLNTNSIDYTTIFPHQSNPGGEKNFKPVWMPRLASSYQLNQNMAVRGSVSKGYSTPTIAEVRSSDNIINTSLKPEVGTNYEIGYKLKSLNNNWLVDVSAYTYEMKNGIVRQLDNAGNDYYRNAGVMHQKGLELSTWTSWSLTSSIIKNFQINVAGAYNHYRYGDYAVANNNFEGKKITSIPDWTLTNTLIIQFHVPFTLNIYHNHTSSIPLDDANTQFSKKYDLIQAKLNWNNSIKKINTRYQLYIGVDNILNQKYSLGNDINAFGGRYFNASPSMNYYIGTKIAI